VTGDIDHLARLAGIRLEPREREQLARHLAALQELIDGLPAVTDAAGNSGAVDLTPRPDDPAPPLDDADVERLMLRRTGGWLDLPPVRGDHTR
jgi:Asp-tRNA(Asn)/Glu-tRNA(Gln) amidotransferase C subunit